MGIHLVGLVPAEGSSCLVAMQTRYHTHQGVRASETCRIELSPLPRCSGAGDRGCARCAEVTAAHRRSVSLRRYFAPIVAALISICSAGSVFSHGPPHKGVLQPHRLPRRQSKIEAVLINTQSVWQCTYGVHDAIWHQCMHSRRRLDSEDQGTRSLRPASGRHSRHLTRGSAGYLQEADARCQSVRWLHVGVVIALGA